MKKIMILAAAAALVLTASCAKNEVLSSPPNDNAIGFSNYVPKSITKADGTLANSTTLINGKKFKVYAYSTANGTNWTSAAIGTQFMNGVDVTYGTGGDSDATQNTYSPTRYWPSGSSPDWLTFWAYYPSQDGNGIVYTAPTGSNGVGSYAFTAASTAAAMVDFMVADVKNDMYYGTTGSHPVAVNGVVPLTFKHQLTKIRFQFKTDLNPATDALTKIVLTDAKLYNVKTTGTLSTTYTTGTTGTNWGSVNVVDSNSDNEGDVVYEITISGSDIDNEVLTYGAVGAGYVGGADGDVFLMIPQTMIASNGSYPQKVVVTWDVKTFSAEPSANVAKTETTVGNNGLLSITHNTATLYLDECVTEEGGNVQANIDWAMNQFTTYRFVIGPKPIQFTATVTAWDNETFGYFNVQ